MLALPRRRLPLRLPHKASCRGLRMGDNGTLFLEGLVKTFGRKDAVRGVTFSMQSGEVVGLLGPNGAGKTTVFYMVVGFIRPTAGRIWLGGKDISGLPMYKRARLGISYLPQEPSVFRKLSVEDNVAAIIETRSSLTRAQKKQLLDRLLDELGIAHLRRQKAYTLSGGERRRTEIARSLAIEPKFLLLDEPFRRHRSHHGCRAQGDRPEAFRIGASGSCSPTTTSATPWRSPTVPTSSTSGRSW